MVSKIDISGIRLDQLNSARVAWISKFAHILRQRNRKVISLRDDDVLKNMVYEAKRTDSNELKKIYRQLKATIHARLYGARCRP